MANRPNKDRFVIEDKDEFSLSCKPSKIIEMCFQDQDRKRLFEQSTADLKAIEMKDKKFKSIWNVSKAEVEKRGNIPHRVPKEVIIAICVYTYEADYGQVYRDFNRDVREIENGKHMTFKWKGFYGLLLWACKYLPNLQGKVYRGVQIEIEGRVGDLVTFEGFCSTSASKEEACNFSGIEKGTLLQLRIEKGISINEYSFFPSEGEILLPPNRIFEIRKVREKAAYNEITMDYAGNHHQ